MKEYYKHPFTSNSELSRLKAQLSGRDQYESEDAFAMGSLVDAMLTQPARVDYFKKKHGADRIYISVSLDNAVARKMYSDLGFREIKETEYSYSGHLYREIQMIKHL